MMAKKNYLLFKFQFNRWKMGEKEQKSQCTLYDGTVWRVETPTSPYLQHFLNKLIFLNVVIQISVAQTSVQWRWLIPFLLVCFFPHSNTWRI
jgi:hypothetical protein